MMISRRTVLSTLLFSPIFSAAPISHRLEVRLNNGRWTTNPQGRIVFRGEDGVDSIVPGDSLEGFLQFRCSESAIVEVYLTNVETSTPMGLDDPWVLDSGIETVDSIGSHAATRTVRDMVKYSLPDGTSGMKIYETQVAPYDVRKLVLKVSQPEWSTAGNKSGNGGEYDPGVRLLSYDVRIVARGIDEPSRVVPRGTDEPSRAVPRKIDEQSRAHKKPSKLPKTGA